MTGNFHCISSRVFPLQFSIPEIKIIQKVPIKDRDFAYIVPGQLHTYIYNTEFDYYHDYQRSYFAITHKKGGWDCMRHYEILANGCIPYFVDIENSHPNAMPFLPKELIKEAMNLEGVSYCKIDHTKFNKKRYFEILHELLEHTKKYLTTKNMARYILNAINYSGKKNILFLSKEISPDYLRECTLIGFKELLGDRIIDIPKIDFLYTNYGGDIMRLYGKGISYTKILDDSPIDRNNVELRIKNKEFDLVIYGSAHRGLLFHDIVSQIYDPTEIIYICGEDTHYTPSHSCNCIDYCYNLFLREFPDAC